MRSIILLLGLFSSAASQGTCGCEVESASFCNYDYGDGGFCESCPGDDADECDRMGLPIAGAQDCRKWCFGEESDACTAESDESSEGSEEFAQYDLNCDGFMTSDEMLVLGMPMEAWLAMLAHYDAGDLDGKISLDEVLQVDGGAPANLLMDRIGARLAEHKKQVRAARLRLLAGPL